MIQLAAVTRCLSQAIVDVAGREFNHLRNEMCDVDVARSVEGALQSLKGLASGKMPAYNEWDAPFYLTWHHPKHVNLAYSMIAATLKNTERKLPKNLYLLDFGCGTLATQFGLALAIADLRDEQPVKSVRVRPIDASEPMRSLGKKAWDRFGELVGESAELAALSDTINSTTFTDDSPTSGEECWLSAMHVVYQANKGDVTKSLALHESETRPRVGFITSHVDDDTTLAQTVSPFEDERVYSRHLSLKRVNPIFIDDLPEITKWRWQVKECVLNPLPAEVASNLPLITDKGYLDRPVSWKWPSAACRVYTRIG